MGFPAARLEDAHTCPMFDPPTPNGPCLSPDTHPHVGGPIVGDSSPDVNVNGKKAARAGDKARCEAMQPLDLIVIGASDVFINGRLAAVVGSKTFHGGVVVAGSPDVNMGSSMAGATFGNADAGTRACRAAAESRSRYKTVDADGNPIPDDKRNHQQGKDNNCGQEAVRQLCIQKCKDGNLPSSSPACQACTTKEDDWYAKYMKDEKDPHNQINEDVRQKTRAQNEKIWNEQVLTAGAVSTSRRSGQFDPAASSWEQHQGQTLYLWSGSKISVNNDPKDIVKIEQLPPQVTDPDKDAKDGQIGSFPETRQDMLKKSCGIDSTLGDNDPQSVAGDLADGHSVIVPVNVGTLNGQEPQGGHVVTVTEMQFDKDGNLVKITCNDTGNPDGTNVCGRTFTGPGVDQFKKAMLPGKQTNVV
jgi:uncharacterized Zn-binding protein involved in type VI secretion